MMPFFKMPDIFYTKPTAPTHTIKYGEKPAQQINVRIPDGPGPHPLLFTIHGGQWKAAYRAKQLEYLCEDLRQHGIATCNLEFRRLGHIGGGFPGTFDDLSTAINTALKHTEEWNIDTNRMSILGHSSGGHLAFTLNSVKTINFAPRAMIAIAGVFDVDAVTGSFKDVVQEFFGSAPHLSPVRLTQPSGARQLLLVGERDKLLDQAKDYIEKHPTAQLKVVGRAAHFTVIDPTFHAWPEIRQAILDVAI